MKAAVDSRQHPTRIVTTSWTADESDWDPFHFKKMEETLERASKKGISVCAASGDLGSSNGKPTGNHVNFPPSSPHALACGGTTLISHNLKYDAATIEIVWNNETGASGGGFSKVFEQPRYQIVATCDRKRGIPDVAGLADIAMGWIILLQGELFVSGGTSAVAPMWAAYLAGIGCNIWINPAIYKLWKCFRNIVHDITVGNNGAYVATIGWDPCTGLGSPNGPLLTPLLQTQFRCY